MRIARALVDEIVEHAREDLPNECCGIVATRDGDAVQVFRARNEYKSPVRFRVHSEDQIRIYFAIQDAGLESGAMYHSHVKSEAYPSQTDINMAKDLSDVVWLIVSLANPDQPDLRGFRITGTDVEEVALQIE